LCVLPAPLPLAEARRVLVFAPHPDDESIGCGGLVARLVQLGVPVRVVLVTDGSGAGGLPPGSDLLRQDEFRAALQVLGVSDHGMLGFPDGELAATSPLFEAVAGEVQAYAPNWLVGPTLADPHRDHRCVAQAVQRAAVGCASVHAVLEYEIWSPVAATHVLDITQTFPIKMAALSRHVIALEQLDYCFASAGLSRYRALLLGSKSDDAAAEAFLLTERGTGFAWPAGWGRPEGWPDA
jgi:LmbE family N-acetylglucosaminyl deacetylase